ncbi:MAG: hypothetical protein D6763_06135, partial [Alphaproteobacteria bacterium]
IAAAREGRRIPFDELVTFCREAIDGAAEVVLVEGVGGAFVPLDEAHTVADWIAALDIPALVVAGSYLGTLSHTVATVEAMQGRGLTIAGLVVSESAQAPMTLGETVAALERLLPGLAIHALPRLARGGGAPLWQVAPDLTGVLPV